MSQSTAPAEPCATAAEGFRDQIAGLSLQAEAKAQALHGGVSVRLFDIAGIRIGLRFFGSALEDHVLPAIAHLEQAGEAQPDYTITCWDVEELQLPYPAAPVTKADFTPRGEITPLCSGGITTAFDPGGMAISLFDAESREGWYVVGRTSNIPRFERAEPMRGLLSWILRQHRRQFIHAGAVGHADGGVLLLGRSGMGKSNSCLSTLQSSLLYASDDFCAISTDPVPMAHSIYCTGKTRHSDWDRHPFFADLAPDIDPEGFEKVIYFLNRAVPERLSAGFPIRALLVVRQGFDETKIVPAAPELAMTEIAPDTTRLLPAAGLEVLREVTKLVRAAPTFMLQLGPDPSSVAPAIEDFLQEFRADQPAPV